jgi:hypothetical protein
MYNPIEQLHSHPGKEMTVTLTYAETGFLLHWTWVLVNYQLPKSNFRKVDFLLSRKWKLKITFYLFQYPR